MKTPNQVFFGINPPVALVSRIRLDLRKALGIKSANPLMAVKKGTAKS